MTTTLDDLLELHAAGALTPEVFRALPRATQEEVAKAHALRVLSDQRANQIAYYRPINAEATRLHTSTAREIGIQGGNKSGKTGTMLAEAAIQMTSIVPESLRGIYPASKVKHEPIRVRLVVSSLVSAWEQNLKQKLQYFYWNGKLNEHRRRGDPRLGHWGWIPQGFLLNGDWERSWSAAHRVLQLYHPVTRAPWSQLQVMSWDQDISDFNQGAFDLILEDEIPPEDVHRANRIRVMELGGQILTGGTPPDDRSSAVTAAWFLDTILRPGLEGVNPTEVFAIQLWTEKNRTLSEADVAYVAKGLTPDQKRARLHGEFIHLAGLVIQGFKERATWWCFGTCDGPTWRVAGVCERCGGHDLTEYAHVWGPDDMDWPPPQKWPVVFYMDPHQSRPTACAWFAIDPSDRWWQFHEEEIAGDAAAVKRTVEAFERKWRLQVAWRKGDPKITAQTNQFARTFEGQAFTIREAFDEVGFTFEQANTNFTVALQRIEEALRVNPITRTPRLRVHASCTKTIYAIGHFTWIPAGRGADAVGKDQPSRRNSDFPALWRYCAMDDPEHRYLVQASAAAERPISLFSGSGRGRTGW